MNTTDQLIAEVYRYGVDGDRLKATPPARLPSHLQAELRAVAAEIKARLRTAAAQPMTCPVAGRIARLDAERREADRQARRGYDFDPSAPEPGRAAWPRSVAPDSRHPLILPEARAKIEAIEAEARAKGWPAELLWNANFWDRPRGLAAVLNQGDEITEVAVDHITILKVKRDMLRFRRHVA